MIIKPTYTTESIEEQHIDDFDQMVIENLVLKYGSDNLFHSMVERNQLFENEDIEEAYSLKPHEYGGNFNSDTDFSNFTEENRLVGLQLFDTRKVPGLKLRSMKSRFTQLWPGPPGLQVRYILFGILFAPRTIAASARNSDSRNCVASSMNSHS